MIHRWKTSSRQPILAHFLFVPNRAIPTFVLCCVGLIALPSARAQPASRAAEQALPVLARYVSDEAAVFVELDNLGQVDARFKTDKLWQILSPMAGQVDISGWRNLLAEAVGAESEAAVKELFGWRVAIAAMDWDNLADGIVLFSIPHAKYLKRIIKPDRVRLERPSGKVTLYEMKSGFWIATDGTAVMVSQKFGSKALFNKSIRLLRRRSKGSLFESEAFRLHVGRLPYPRHACLFWARRSAPSVDADRGSSPAAIWPDVSHGALGVCFVGDQVEVIVRGTADEKETFEYQPRVVLDRIVSLPQTTLAVWATSLDVQRAYEKAREAPPLPVIEQLWAMIDEHSDANRFGEDVVTNLGPRCVALIGSDMTTKPSHPQIGILFESVDAQGVVEALTEMAGDVLGAVVPRGAGRTPVGLASSDHLGTMIHTLRFAEPVPAPQRHTIASLVAGDMSLSFAAIKGWVVLSTSPAHIGQIVEAANGLGPTLGEALVPSAATGSLRSAVVAGVLQPSYMSDMFQSWTTLMQDRQPPDPARGARLGITVRTDPLAGQVVVAGVNSNGLSAGKLEPGDAIIACNGTLLQMATANEHLRRLVAGTAPIAPIRLRILRGKNILDVSINAMPGATPVPTLGPDVREGPMAEALGPIASLQGIADEVALAVYSVARPSPNTYHARLLLKFHGVREPLGQPAP